MNIHNNNVLSQGEFATSQSSARTSLSSQSFVRVAKASSWHISNATTCSLHAGESCAVSVICRAVFACICGTHKSLLVLQQVFPLSSACQSSVPRDAPDLVKDLVKHLVYAKRHQGLPYSFKCFLTSMLHKRPVIKHTAATQ